MVEAGKLKYLFLIHKKLDSHANGRSLFIIHYKRNAPIQAVCYSLLKTYTDIFSSVSEVKKMLAVLQKIAGLTLYAQYIKITFPDQSSLQVEPAQYYSNITMN